MTIIFNHEKEFEYIDAYSLERDFKNGYTRPSLEVNLIIDYNEIAEIIKDIKHIKLIGNPIISEEGYVLEIPESEYVDYSIPGKISVEDGITTFKVYRLSDTEIKIRDAEAAIDELLIAMEEV